MFDNIYVLAKGGICVFSGPPMFLRQHLNECGVECNENQVPIEVLIKMSEKSVNNTKVMALMNKTNEEIKQSMNGLNEMKVINNGLKKNIKRFSFVHFFHVLTRIFDRTFLSNFKLFVLQLLAFVVMIANSLLMIDQKIYEWDGCIQLNTVPNISCAQQKDQESLSDTNTSFSTFLIIYTSVAIFITIGLVYSKDMKTFLTEHRSG